MDVQGVWYDKSGHSNVDDLVVQSPIMEGDRLIYAGRDCYLIPEELYSYAQQVKTLDLSYNSIRDLEGLEHFSDSLEALILDNNEITETTEFEELPQLQLLSLCNNLITDLYAFIDGVASKLPRLMYLSLLGNKACPDSLTQSDCDEVDYARYRKYVIYKIPGLKFLDSKPVTDAERKEAKRAGQYMRVIKPQTSVEEEFERSERSIYRPLPEDSRSQQSNKSTRGTLKKARSSYHGRHSEGNRFIRNNDL
ncbi:leucine-rich melanocyte differentiation-associated protein-like [Watersipora subatra]|uniref:leucine-rich melanocyte differentiation-associated protein-like n=1 Tax=Watersipora subatra TaxID=2589382 RepID=UPI00355AFB17